MIGRYYVGQIPKDPLRFDITDNNGNVINLADYDYVRARMLDSDDRQVDLSMATVSVSEPQRGRVILNWPTVSLFNKPGEYVLQLELIGSNGSRDFTNTQLLIVEGFGNAN